MVLIYKLFINAWIGITLRWENRQWAPDYTTCFLQPTALINITWFIPTHMLQFLLTDVFFHQFDHRVLQKYCHGQSQWLGRPHHFLPLLTFFPFCEIIQKWPVKNTFILFYLLQKSEFLCGRHITSHFCPLPDLSNWSVGRWLATNLTKVFVKQHLVLLVTCRHFTSQLITCHTRRFMKQAPDVNHSTITMDYCFVTNVWYILCTYI